MIRRLIILLLLLFSWNQFAGDLVYVAMQSTDEVIILNEESMDLSSINIDYASTSNIPHFIVIDEINRYWFVSAVGSGYLGCYNLDSNALIDSIFIGDSPANMALNETDKKLYISQMLPMGGMMQMESSRVFEIDYSNFPMVIVNEYQLSSNGIHGCPAPTNWTSLRVSIVS